MSNSVSQRLSDKLAFEGSRPNEEQAFLNSLIVRLHGKAFEIADITSLKSVKQLKLKQLNVNDKVRGMRQRRGPNSLGG